MKFRTGALSWRHEVVDKKPLIGKFFKYRFENHHYKNYGNKDYELIIEAKNKYKAQEAFQLFLSALTLLEASCLYFINEIPSVKSYNLGDLFGAERPHAAKTICFSQSGIYKAAKIAARASFRKAHTISLYKYLFGCSQHSNYVMQLDPSHNDYEKLSRNPLDHLRFSYAILVFYSIIEQLGLEIRATSENPSKLNGIWNPAVKQNLETRLKNSKINLSRTAVWNLRSRPTKIHRSEKLKLLKKTSWARNYVRDSEIEIVDAIAHTSWLRSKVLAHKLHDSFLSISIYDVANVNFLIRQLLLNILDELDHSG